MDNLLEQSRILKLDQTNTQPASTRSLYLAVFTLAKPVAST